MNTVFGDAISWRLRNALCASLFGLLSACGGGGDGPDASSSGPDTGKAQRSLRDAATPSRPFHFRERPGLGRTALAALAADAEYTPATSGASDARRLDASPRRLVYRVTDLGTLGGAQSLANAINERGDVVGYSSTAGGMRHAFFWSRGRMIDLGTFGGPTSTANGVNARGEVAGWALRADGTHHAFVYRGSALIQLGTLGGSESFGSGINGWGIVSGDALTQGDAEDHAYLGAPGHLRDLGTLGGTFSLAIDVNNALAATGVSSIAGEAETHAFVWWLGRMNDLGTLGGTESVGVAINERGEVAGFSTVAGDEHEHAVLVTGGVMRDIGTLGGGDSNGIGIDSCGAVVGVSTTATGVSHAFVYRHGLMTDLNSLLDPVTGAGWTLVQALGINDAGQIVGDGAVGGQRHAYLLTPISGGRGCDR